MFCKNCGATMGDFDTICPNCGASSTSNTGYSQANYGGGSSEPIKTTGLLVWSIIELLTCYGFIPGLIALILWITKLKPAADRGDYQSAKQAKKGIKIALWIGIGLLIVFPLAVIMLIAIPNTAGIHARMEVKADKTKAQQIGLATRRWYTEAMSDPYLGYDFEEVEDSFVKWDEIDGLDVYTGNVYAPNSYRIAGKLEDSAYYVTIINEDTPSKAKVVVAIGPESLYSFPRSDYNFSEVFYNDLDGIDSTDVNYDGNGSGIAYVEP